jgi:hypothetical protein
MNSQHPEIIEFSTEERDVLEYFRPSAAGKWRRGSIFELSVIVISLALGVVYVIRGDAGAGFVAYALLFWRAWSAFWRGRRYAKVYRSIFTKYQKKLEDVGS